MTRTWTDLRDDKEWTIEATYAMPAQEAGQPFSVMGPDVLQRISFKAETEEWHTVAKLPEPIWSLPDLVLESLLDEARGTRPVEGPGESPGER